MQPPAEDNYGVDACAISCLDTTPTALVIAMHEGRLHHCLLIPADGDGMENITFQVKMFVTIMGGVNEGHKFYVNLSGCKNAL